MALLVFGSGATRGASFVNAATDPCLPPLDGDFFTQLQRVRNPKHRKLIDDVLADVVGIFGHNFETTMETVFTTLEHTRRMIETTGESKHFKSKELAEISDRLKQAIAVVLEDSIADRASDGTSRQAPRICEYHKRLVSELLRPRDAIVSFNYDCLLDYALKADGSHKWNARRGYGFSLGSGGASLKGYDHWQPTDPAPEPETIHFYKLHGSLHFYVQESTKKKAVVTFKQRPYTKQKGKLQFTIIPPEWHKNYDAGVFPRLWKSASDAIYEAREIVVIGYSLPPTDLHSTALFRTSVKPGSLRSLVVVNPDREARKRVRSVLQRGFSRDTRVLSFDRFEHFVAASRELWDSSRASPPTTSGLKVGAGTGAAGDPAGV